MEENLLLLAARSLDVKQVRREYHRFRASIDPRRRRDYDSQRNYQILPVDYEDVTDEEFAVGQAVQRYKDENGVRFPRIGEVLAVIKALGYRRD